MSQRLIAFAGPKGSGKDSAALSLLAHNSLFSSPTGQHLFEQINFADSVKSVCSAAFNLTHEEMNAPHLKEVTLLRWPYKSPRELMTHVARLFRTMYGPDIWVQRWLPKVATCNAHCLVITDLRHMEEVAPIRERGGKIFYVQNDRVEAIRKEGIEQKDPLWCDPSEAFAEVMRREADFILPNNGSLQDLFLESQGVVRECFGDWESWGLEDLEQLGA